MATIALFHSALGVRPGVLDAAERLTYHGHDVRVVDQYHGRSFGDYEEAQAYVESKGFPALMQSAVDATADLADGFVAAGFSNGAGMAEQVAIRRRVAGALLLSGALPLPFLGAAAWPGVPVQLHYARHDPFRNDQWIAQLLDEIRRSGASVEQHDYPAHGHLFTDPSRPEEYDASSAEMLWTRVLRFLDDLEARARQAKRPVRDLASTGH
jgi:dienelactone hydrolase